MITVTLDTAAVVRKLEFRSDRMMDILLSRLGEFANDRIQTLLKARVSQVNEARYLKALRTEHKKGQYVLIRLADPRVRWLESGTLAYDMKPGILAKAKHTTRDGQPYANVPFLHRTSKRGSGTTFAASKGITRSIKSAVTAVRGGGTDRRLFTGAQGFPYMSKHSDLKVAMETIKGGKTAVTARTWRRVSPNSPESSWRHPGRDGLEILKAVGAEIERDKGRILADLIKDL